MRGGREGGGSRAKEKARQKSPREKRRAEEGAEETEIFEGAAGKQGAVGGPSSRRILHHTMAGPSSALGILGRTMATAGQCRRPPMHLLPPRQTCSPHIST